MSSTVESLTPMYDRLSREDRPTGEHLRAWQQRLAEAEQAELGEFLQHLLAKGEIDSRQDALLATTWPALAPRAPHFDDEVLECLGSLYQRWGAQLAGGGELLRLLVLSGREMALRQMTTLLVEHPPAHPEQAIAPLVPLFRLPRWSVSAVFPKLLDGLATPQLAPAILDLANYVYRSGLALEHPARTRAVELAGLLAAVTERLRLWEGSPPSCESPEAESLAERVREGVTLVVCLCDTLGLIGDLAAREPLRAACGLKHRRLRCEAVAALVRLGDSEAVAELAALAAEPSVRLRVVAYAEELEVADAIDAEYTTSTALAEGELVSWLAEPGQFGFPPTFCELLDRRILAWPGYEEPRECYLFRYCYVQPEGEYVGIGITGPLTLAPGADLSTWPVDDLYALFAGWHVEHPEVAYRDSDQLSAEEREEAWSLADSLAELDFTRAVPRLWGTFFGRQLLVLEAEWRGTKGLVLVDDAGAREWLPQSPGPRPWGPAELFYRHVGRWLLAEFNECFPDS